MVPDTISFQPLFNSPDEPNAFLPIRGEVRSKFASGVADSGLIVLAPILTDGFCPHVHQGREVSDLSPPPPGTAGTVDAT